MDLNACYIVFSSNEQKYEQVYECGQVGPLFPHFGM